MWGKLESKLDRQRHSRACEEEGHNLSSHRHLLKDAIRVLQRIFHFSPPCHRFCVCMLRGVTSCTAALVHDRFLVISEIQPFPVKLR
ncbi:unnamed protein product [Chondrus crispus]|uniref:Uncharacterized protein n=1 Tax=Chondrus crispus TaxID=2769 RepID=R7Q678_CHOCR|nr:unnamed protein product [Chondrus crispus]CDF33358.1 unnamed protein product [Chondrus crispus]|eukprot:XP_005713161.1 unnamed protein product [Chondrus crispus]